jgi:hypothetical protein
MRNTTHCIHCGCFINPKYGSESPAAHQGHEGTDTDPRSPGDYDNICDQCNFGNGLRGGANAEPTYEGDHSEWLVA